MAKLAKGPDAFANILQGMGVPGAHFMAWSTILVEILGGLTVILGAFVTLASAVHLPYGFSSIKLPGGNSSRCAVRSSGL